MDSLIPHRRFVHHHVTIHVNLVSSDPLAKTNRLLNPYNIESQPFISPAKLDPMVPVVTILGSPISPQMVIVKHIFWSKATLLSTPCATSLDQTILC